MKKCDHIGPIRPFGTFTWGVFEIAGIPRHKLDIPMNSSHLCQVCAEDLWKRIEHSVAAGYMFYQAKPYIGEEKID